MPNARSNLSRRLLDGRRRISVVVATVAGLLLLAGSGGQGLDRWLREVRDSVRDRPASGEIHIVEIDARSLAEIDRWPWPRRVHAEAVHRLHAAGVRTIAFDVDFSSLSTPDEDAAFAAALEGAGGAVLLPALRQYAGAGRSQFIDSMPAKPFRKHAFLASVTVVPDDDGQIRKMPLGVGAGSAATPSLAALLAEMPAETGRFFPIDYSIDPASIPRHSFADVVADRVAPERLAGKRVLIGATAVELGDRYAVPGHGVLPGVVIQALAAETLLGGRVPATGPGLLPLALAVALTAFACRRGGGFGRVALFAAGTAAILALPFAGEAFFALTIPVAPALGTLAVATICMVGLHFAARFRERTMTDSGTGLPNLAALEAQAADAPDGLVVVARIDRFAEIAAGLGPAATAALVRRVADRVAFADGGTIYRIDEADLAWLEADGAAAPLSQRLDALWVLMRTPVDCGRPVDVRLTFGIAERCTLGAKHQVANAALAAVQAARNGTRWERHRDADPDASAWHLSLIGELDAAMSAEEVWNAYQPKLDLATGRIIGAEALVRWDHPQRGRINPDQFIPIVEEHGRISDLTAHVLERALADARAWAEAGAPLGVAINVSAGLLADAAFVGMVEERIRAAGVPPERITLEVTETAAMNEPAKAIAALESWRALGVQISIDDYGTGQSSLGYLQRLPATELKLDMSFVTTLAVDPRNAIVVRSTIAMAHELGMKVVAEGVEDAGCLELLGSMGCDIAQGWHVGRPVPAAELRALVKAEERAAA